MQKLGEPKILCHSEEWVSKILGKGLCLNRPVVGYDTRESDSSLCVLTGDSFRSGRLESVSPFAKRGWGLVVVVVCVVFFCSVFS